MRQPLILFENFGFQYRAQSEPTLYDINLSINPGEKILIAGASGSGKSTLAHCINGLIPFNYPGKCTGRLSVGGSETSAQSIFELSKIVGTVLQDSDGQFVGLTVGEDIAFSMENDCVVQEEMLSRVEAAAKLTGIGDTLDASPFNLSGGQKQRVSMSGVIVDSVQALLFDEPLANLDPATGKQAIDLIDRIMGETDATVIIIEHRLEDVLYRHIDRVVLMDNGRIIADMPPDELLSTDLLSEYGIREPLYVTALKYAGVTVTTDNKTGRIDTLKLNTQDKEAVRGWFTEKTRERQKSPEKELLNISDLSFIYAERTVPALSDVSFNVNEGEMTAIVGTNGAGKSTLAKLICGFESPKNGRIKLRGVDITKQSIAARAAVIGYVCQNPNQMLSKPLIYDEVALGLRSRGITEIEVAERVEQTLAVCGLRPFRKWPVSALSFGQKKRVTIASVLVMNPNVIILDEPTAGQDFRHYTDIMEFLRTLNAQGVTVLMITHDMHLMLEYAPRALVFSGGRLLADVASASLLCDAKLTREASLKETSLFELAQMCGIDDETAFVRHFVDFDRELRDHG